MSLSTFYRSLSNENFTTRTTFLILIEILLEIRTQRGDMTIANTLSMQKTLHTCVVVSNRSLFNLKVLTCRVINRKKKSVGGIL